MLRQSSHISAGVFWRQLSRRCSTVGPPAWASEPFSVPSKLLLGPGPSNASPAVLAAMAKPLLGYLHPEFLQIMRDVSEGLRYAFQTESRTTFAVSGTGHAGMEAALGNLLEAGDAALVTEAGLWGGRAAEIARRYGANVTVLHNDQGRPFTLDQLEEGLDKAKPKLLFLVHGESSTGTLQPLDGVGELCRRKDCLLVVDTVASLGATPFRMDDWGVDAVYSATQKALSAPPGLAPIAFSQRAWHKIVNRSSPCRSYYLDMVPVANYWGCDAEPPRYHHTGMVSLTYALREALAGLANEGLEHCVQRHQRNALRLHGGLHKLGLELFVPEAQHRLPSLTTIKVPAGVDWARVVRELMERERIELAGGLGATAGKVWRIGLMGHNSTEANVDKVLAAMGRSLEEQGFQA